MSIWKLRFSMLGTLAVIVGLSTLFFTVLLSLTGAFNFTTLIVFVILFNIAQWLFAPYLIDLVYRARRVSKSDNPELYGMVERLSQKSGIKTPWVMVANIPVPNAFAYGSPIAGTRVAVTKGLLETLEHEEVEAVIGHELGHLKHRDVQVMMFVSLLPAIFYFIGYSMILSSMFGRRDERSNSGAAIAIGMACMLAYWILYIFTLYLSRLREYYADRHSAAIVEDGPRKLSEGLAKIVHSSRRMRRTSRKTSNFSSFKSLFISDPDRSELDTAAITQARALMADRKLVEKVLTRKVTTLDRIAEILSSHPNIVKRLRTLQELT
ncbi:MAG: M48 family metalloprotease [Candidatus Bathyarchaeota archaeon]|nr:MAG: M48 family metalloprotease [Candidatus Bathyarchaeota archaeon]